jgi:hypothetical protein
MGDQKSKWHETRKARLDELFEGKKFRVVEEFKSDEPVATPLGYKVKSGYKLREINHLTRDVREIVVGKSLLNKLADDYDAVDKPEPKRRGRPRKQPIEQAEEWAGRDIPDTAYPVTQPGETYVNPNANEEFKG